MRPEAYIVSYDQKARGEGIKSNILHYLGEYRLWVKFDEFSYRVEEDPVTGNIHLAKDEPGPVRDRFHKAILAREQAGLSVRREVAECLGFQRLEKNLINSPDNSLFVWVSPPGPRVDGYGNYSFTFVGQVIKDHDGRRVRVIPYRNVLSKEEHRNYLSRLSLWAKSFVSDTDFLANPVVFLPRPGLETPEDILEFIGEREKFNADWFNRLAEKVEPLIQGYINLIKEGVNDEELLRALFAIENYTLAMRDSLMAESPASWLDLKKTIPYFFQEWGRQAPPAVAGSCGSSASTLMEYHNLTLTPDKYGSRTFACPECGKMNIRPKDELLSSCQHCGSSKIAC